MRGSAEKQIEAFSYIPLEDRIPAKHLIRPFKAMVNAILRDMDGALDAIYSGSGRPSIAPENQLRASILQILYSIRSERALMEEIEFNILFRWFVGLGLDAPVWDHSTFTKNRDRPLESDIAKLFFAKVVERAKRKKFLCDEHFTVDGSLIEAWASMKSFQPRDGNYGQDGTAGGGSNPDVDFRGQAQSNDTHESKTDKGYDAWLSPMDFGNEPVQKFVYLAIL
jgi:transposase